MLPCPGNSATMNIGVHMSLSILVSSVCMPSSGIAGSYGSSISSFLRNLHTVPKDTFERDIDNNFTQESCVIVTLLVYGAYVGLAKKFFWVFL